MRVFKKNSSPYCARWLGACLTGVRKSGELLVRLKLRPVKKDKRQNMSYGFGLHDLPLLASYSRSGTNWIRYFIEFASGLPTPGQTRLIQGKNYFIDRAHCAYPIMTNYNRVLLVLRDYRECLLRHHKESWYKQPNVEAFLTNEALKQPPSWYIKNIKAFDRFEGKKLLIYYEDLLQQPEISFLKLAEFLELNPLKVQIFLKNIDQHFEGSIQAYTKGGHLSETSSTKDFKYHSRTALTPAQVEEFDQYYFTQYPGIAEKYLRRYNTRSQSTNVEKRVESLYTYPKPGLIAAG